MVFDGAAFGIPDAETGQSVKGVVQRTDPDDASEEFAAELIDCRRPVALEVANLSGRAGQRSRGWRRLVRESFVAPAFPMCV